MCVIVSGELQLAAKLLTQTLPIRLRSRTTLAADMSVQIRRCNRDIKVPGWKLTNATDLEQLILFFRLLVSRATVMLDHLSLNVKVLFGLIKMDFIVSGTAWFSVIHISTLHFFRLWEPVQKFHFWHTSVELSRETACYRVGGAKYSREMLPEFRPHQCVPFQTVLRWNDLVLSGNGASLPAVIIKPQSRQLHKQNLIYKEFFCSAIRNCLFFWHVLERHIFTVISLGNHRNKSTICLDSFSFEKLFSGLNWLTCFLWGVCLH